VTVGGRYQRDDGHMVTRPEPGSIPDAPGSYQFKDGVGRVIYVGKAKSLRARLLSYFRVNSRDPKAGTIIDHTRVLVWEQDTLYETYEIKNFSSLAHELQVEFWAGGRFDDLFEVRGFPRSQRGRVQRRRPHGKAPCSFQRFRQGRCPWRRS